MIRQEVRARARYQGSQPSNEVQRLEGDRGGSVAPVPAQRADHGASGRERETSDLDRRAGNLPAQPLQPFAIGGLGPHLRVQRELLDVASQRTRNNARAFGIKGITPPAKALRTSPAPRTQPLADRVQALR